MKQSYLLFIFFCLPFLSSASNDPPAEKDNRDEYQVHIARTSEKIRIDGDLNESVWQSADKAGDFWMNFPVDDEKANPKTEVQLTYDDNFLYIAATCYGKKDYVIQTLKRDVDFWSGDGFVLLMDPLNQRTNGFIFGANPMGVQMESLVSGSTGTRGSRFRGVNGNWDNKWFTETQIYDDRWTVEIAIPFKTLRYEEGRTTWGINFIRSDAKNNAFHTWTKVPIQFRSIEIGYTGALIWDAAPRKVKGNIAVIPYVTGGLNQDFVADDINERDLNTNFNAGLDAKIAVSSSLNLDLTLNPDFSQVEVDQQVTNLSRFNIRFPERRTFFLENSEIFEDFGSRSARPFFSRKIGLDEDGNSIPILYGLRLSGNATKNARVGLMNIHTNGDEDSYGQNYTAFAVHHRVFSRSTVKGYVLNRVAADGGELIAEDYGRNAGLEFNYLSKNGKTRSWVGYNHSFKKGIDDKNYSFKLGGNYANKEWSFFASYNFVHDNYYADMGFLNMEQVYDPLQDTTFRQGNHSFWVSGSRTFFADRKSKINTHKINVRNGVYHTPSGDLYERRTSGEYELQLQNTARATFEVSNIAISLLRPLNFTDDEFEDIPVDDYIYSSVELRYRSDRRNSFVYEVEFLRGGFYNGKRTSILLGLNYRTQPWGNFGVQFNFNDLDFPDPYGSTQLFLVGPKAEISFSKNLFWTTFLQYNTQADNFNINSRLQWRFKPMSDFFLVYTDNYSVDVFAPKNRALVFKMNYWLNL